MVKFFLLFLIAGCSTVTSYENHTMYRVVLSKDAKLQCTMYGYNILKEDSERFYTKEGCEKSDAFKKMEQEKNNYEHTPEGEAISSRGYYYVSLESFGSMCRILTGNGANLDKPRFKTYSECQNSKEFKESELQFAQDKKEKEAKVEQGKMQKFNQLLKKHPNYKKYRKNIAEGSATIGMPEELLVLSVGEPREINTSTNAHSVHKQYVYGSGNYVYVVNGIVESFQQSN